MEKNPFERTSAEIERRKGPPLNYPPPPLFISVLSFSTLTMEPTDCCPKNFSLFPPFPIVILLRTYSVLCPSYPVSEDEGCLIIGHVRGWKKGEKHFSRLLPSGRGLTTLSLRFSVHRFRNSQLDCEPQGKKTVLASLFLPAQFICSAHGPPPLEDELVVRQFLGMIWERHFPERQSCVHLLGPPPPPPFLGRIMGHIHGRGTFSCSFIGG